MYGYIYLTTNNVNDKKYIGQHRSSVFEESYKGSGVLLQKAFDKYGKENFTTILLDECNSEEELNDKEIYYIALSNAVDSEDFYNVAKGGLGHTYSPWNKGLTNVQEVTQRQLEALEKGRHLPASEKQKQQLRERRGGCVVSEHTRQLLRERRKEQVFTEETRKKMSDSHKGDKNPNRIKSLTVGISSETKNKIRNAQIGRKHIHKGTQNRNVPADELNSYLEDGWELGYYYN